MFLLKFKCKSLLNIDKLLINIEVAVFNRWHSSFAIISAHSTFFCFIKNSWILFIIFRDN